MDSTSCNKREFIYNRKCLKDRTKEIINVVNKALLNSKVEADVKQKTLLFQQLCGISWEKIRTYHPELQLNDVLAYQCEHIIEDLEEFPVLKIFMCLEILHTSNKQFETDKCVVCGSDLNDEVKCYNKAREYVIYHTLQITRVEDHEQIIALDLKHYEWSLMEFLIKRCLSSYEEKQEQVSDFFEELSGNMVVLHVKFNELEFSHYQKRLKDRTDKIIKTIGEKLLMPGMQFVMDKANEKFLQSSGITWEEYRTYHPELRFNAIFASQCEHILKDFDKLPALKIHTCLKLLRIANNQLVDEKCVTCHSKLIKGQLCISKICVELKKYIIIYALEMFDRKHHELIKSLELPDVEWFALIYLISKNVQYRKQGKSKRIHKCFYRTVFTNMITLCVRFRNGADPFKY